MPRDDEDSIMTGVYIGLGVIAAAGLAWATWRYVLSDETKRKVARAAEDATRKAKRLAEDVAYKSRDVAKGAAHTAGAAVKDAASSVRSKF